MNPTDHTARITSPHIERAESAGVVDDAFVLPSTPVAAAEVAGAIGSLEPAPVRHRQRPSMRRVIAFWAVLVVAESALLVWLWSLLAGGVL